jgi:hypothetical protein
MKKFLAISIGLFLLGLVQMAGATIITTPLPSNVYITQGDLDWTWASPVNVQYFQDNELKLPSFHSEGWRFATDLEMASHPLLADFTRPDGSYIQSVAYWNTVYTHVDYSDLNSGYVYSAWGHDVAETLYVRGGNETVPEPATMLLFGLGLMGLAGVRRKFKK